MKKKIPCAVIALASVVVAAAALFAAKNCLYSRRPLDLTFDAAYYFSEESSASGVWAYEKSFSGHQYYLYLPQEYREASDEQSAKLPLIVAFHGSDEKGQAFKYGRIFTGEDFQKKIYPKGAAVLLIFSRINYFTDPHGTALLIKNVCIKNKCLDPTNIVGYGFSCRRKKSCTSFRFNFTGPIPKTTRESLSRECPQDGASRAFAKIPATSNTKPATTFTWN